MYFRCMYSKTGMYWEKKDMVLDNTVHKHKKMVKWAQKSTSDNTGKRITKGFGLDMV